LPHHLQTQSRRNAAELHLAHLARSHPERFIAFRQQPARRRINLRLESSVARQFRSAPQSNSR
jgi:hypothetical protein